MTEYRDLACGDDLDLFGRETDPLETLQQDLEHRLFADRGSLVFDPNFGLGLRNYIGKPLPSTLASEIEESFGRDDRVLRAKCTITPHPTEPNAYRIEIGVTCTDGFVALVVEMTRTSAKVVS